MSANNTVLLAHTVLLLYSIIIQYYYYYYSIISTDEDPSLRIESSAIINLYGVSTKLNKYIVFTMQTYKEPTVATC